MEKEDKKAAVQPTFYRYTYQRRFGPHDRARDSRGTMRRLLPFYAAWWRQIAVVIVITLFSTGFSLAIPYLSGQAVDQFDLMTGAVDRGKLTQLLLLLLLCVVLQALCNFGRRGLMETVSQRMVEKLRQDCFAKLTRLPLSYFGKHSHGDIMSRLSSDADNVSAMVAETITRLCHSLLMIVGSLVLMLKLNARLTLIFLVTVPIILLSTRAISQQSRKYYRQQASQLGRVSAIVQEHIRNSRTVKLFDYRSTVMEQFYTANQTLRATAIRAQIWSGFLTPVVSMINNLGFALLACLGGLMSCRGEVEIWVVISLLGYSKQLGSPLNSIAALFSLIQQALAGAERLFEVMDEAEQDAGSGAVAAGAESVRGCVTFDDVSFAYEPGKPVLEHVSFTAQAGETIAFVGETGAGKTTLVNLLTRFYDPDAGSIRLDGVPLSDYPRRQLNRCFSVVLQDSVFFTGTVLDNLRYGRPEATEDEVVEAAKLACVHDFILRLPQGYHTVMSGSAGEFSHGQRQLLAMARALLCRAQILILDEATSNVDTITEKRIQQATLQLMQGHTCFLIAHRLSTIRNADRIYVIGGGGILESGTHEELLARQGIYWNMLNSRE